MLSLGDYYCMSLALTRGAIEPHRIYGEDKVLVAQLKILEQR